jgi:Rieske Fe-S protein
MCANTKTTVMNRRQFLFLTAAAGAAGATGCDAARSGDRSAVRPERVINAGPVADYAADGVHDRFRNLGFFIVRRRESLIVLSSVCTHRKCKLEAEADRSFYCPCHGSTFDPTGHVMRGPAIRNLPVLPSFVDERGQLLVRVPAG